VDDNIKLLGTIGKVWYTPTFVDLYYLHNGINAVPVVAVTSI
jgi:hypothetical protein